MSNTRTYEGMFIFKHNPACITMKIMRHKDISIIGEYLLSAHLLFLAPGLDYLGSQHQTRGVLHALVYLSKTTPSGRRPNDTYMRPTFHNFIHIFEVCNIDEAKRSARRWVEQLQPVPHSMQNDYY